MVKKQTTLHINAFFDAKGNFSHFSLDQFKGSGEMGDYGVHVCISAVEVGFEVPEAEEIRLIAADKLAEFIKKKMGQQQLELLRLRAAENAMRGIAYDEPIEMPKAASERDDIPF